MKDLLLIKKRSHRLRVIICIMIVSVLFSGCQTLEVVKSDQIHIPGDMTAYQTTDGGHQIVYAVSAGMMTNRLTIQKFGVYYLDDSHMKIGHGLSSIIYINDMNHRMQSELDRVLRIYHFDSLNDFIAEYQTKKPIFPGSGFVALPSSLGRELFTLAQKFRGWDDWVLKNRDEGLAP